MPNMFAKATKVEKKPTAAAAKKAKFQLALVGLEAYAAMDLISKSIKTEMEQLELQLKGDVVQEFVRQGVILKKQPDNFEGYEGDGEASCQLRKRSVNSVLNDEMKAMYKEHGIPTKTVTIVEEAYRFNPAYLNNQAMLEKISKALEKIKDLPEDLIQLQEAEGKVVADDNALDVLFTKTPATILAMIENVGVPALRVKFKGGDIAKAMDIVKPELGLSDEVKAEKTKARVKANAAS